MIRVGTQRTSIHRTESTGISNENVQTTKVFHRGSDHLFSPGHIAHIGRKGKDLCGGTLAENRIFALVEGSLRPSHQCERGTSTGVLQRNLGTDAARCASDQHNLVCECLCVVVDLGVDCWIDT